MRTSTPLRELTNWQQRYFSPAFPRGGTAAIGLFFDEKIPGGLDISGHNALGVKIGSLEGVEQTFVFLGANNLTVGTNNLSTTFTGVIRDGGESGGTGGSLTKVGTETFILSGANTYTRDTNINRGVLQVDGSITSNTVVKRAGTLTGTGTIHGDVTNGPIAGQIQRDCHDTLPWPISVSLGRSDLWCMAQQVKLTPFSPAHQDLLKRWLAAPHVTPWFPQPAEHIVWALSPPPGGDHALIMSGGQPVGYIRWEFVSRNTLDSLGLFEIPANSVDVDLLIGDRAVVRRGIGRCALQLLTDTLRARGDVSLLALTTSVHNHTARRAFEAAGFRVLRQYAPSGYGLCHFMVLQLCTHGGSASEKA